MCKQCYVCDATEDVVRMEMGIWLCRMHRKQFAKNLKTVAEAALEDLKERTSPPVIPVLPRERTTEPLSTYPTDYDLHV